MTRSDSQTAISELGAMRRAIALAERGWGRVHPNPLVGAVVIAADGAVVAEGAHEEFGGPHAERAAITAAASTAHGATLVTTLEPCTHHGKQPPCTDLIIASGVVRVIVGLRDPNPEAAGGLEKLRAAGLKVVEGVAADEVARQNFRFLRRFSETGRPFVAVKLAVTLDGFIADDTGRSQWISGDAAREWVHRERAGYAAIAVGAETAIRDDARLTVRGSVTPRVAPTKVIFDRSGRMREHHGIFADLPSVPVVVIHGPETPPALTPSSGLTLLPAATLAEALGGLRALGIDAVLVEGGGRLAGKLLSEELVDRVYQLQAPVWLGAGRPAWADLGARSIDSATRWHTVDRRDLGDDTLLVMEP
jgi:diaminohydroxyphosphoribosylaminopyrimidine deaminase/5-amino-6-(5-phosphoribosylamino)uracil reductase